jgi:hypothetical protein
MECRGVQIVHVHRLLDGVPPAGFLTDGSFLRR